MAEQIPFGSIEFAANPEPRCPCVLLLDTSASMSKVIGNVGKELGYNVQKDGQTYRAVSGGFTIIDELNEAVRGYHAYLTKDALAAQRIELSVITFGGEVETVIPFVSVSQFIPPTLVADGETPMGAAILQAVETVTERKNIYKKNSQDYFRPFIFLLTDGEPTDEWQMAAAKVRQGEKSKAFAFWAVGVQGANFEILKQISVRTPLHLKGYSFKEMFRWLSQSQQSVSRSNPGQEDQVAFTNPTAPDGWATL
jgi:uncharacterized protein YegL